MIVPVCLGLIGLNGIGVNKRKKQRNVKENYSLVYYLVYCGFHSFFFYWPGTKVVLPYLNDLSHLFMAMALVGIGSKVSWKQFRAAGAAPFW